jgi:hypothetical protein
MPEVDKTQSRRTALGAVAAAVLVLLLGACGSPTPAAMTKDEVAALVRQESGGKSGAVWSQSIKVERENGDVENIVVYVVTKPDRSRVLIDPAGQVYQPTLADFRESNRLLTGGDTITLPSDFPDTVPGQAPAGMVTISGRVEESSPVVWVLGGVVLLAAAGTAGFLWRRKRRPAVVPVPDPVTAPLPVVAAEAEPEAVAPEPRA